MKPIGTKNISGYLLPLFKTKADVIERNTIGIKTFTTGSKYHNLLRREVHHLTELHFLLPDFFLGGFALSDVDHRTGVLNEISARAENRMTNAVNVPDAAIRMHNAIIHSFVRLVIHGSLGRLPERRLIVGMNSLEEFFHPGGTIAWIKTQNAVTCLRPIPGVAVGTPGPTAGSAQPLRFRQVRFAALQILSQLLLLGHIHGGSKKPFENPVVEDWNANATNIANRAVRSNDPLLYVATGTLLTHPLYGLCHEIAVLRVNGGQILLERRGSLLRVEAIDLKQFQGPIFKKTRRIQSPASRLTEALPFCEIKLASLEFLGTPL